jgi:uncharacterized short protein YbdD (DUF466 family)
MNTIPAKPDARRMDAKRRTRPAILSTVGWFTNAASRVWVGIREWCGDNAYDRYVQAQKNIAEGSALLTPAEFYVEQLNRRYSRPNRCC